jgi:hypothetical protein
MDEQQTSSGWLRWGFKWIFRLVVLVVVIVAGVLLYVFKDALWNRYVTFPRQEAAWKELRGQREAVGLDDGWKDYRGVLHTHSHFSHDSEVPFERILASAKEVGVEFLFLTDHCVNTKADFSLQWQGLHDGVHFGRGFEMKAGFMAWNLPEDTALPCMLDPGQLAFMIEEKGGLLFFAHSEEDRMWDLPQLDGMEIYNIHTDFKDERSELLDAQYLNLFPDMILNHNKYPLSTMRVMFDRQTEILKKWDDLNRTRHIVGISANDAHQNIGFRFSYTEEGDLELRPTSPDSGTVFELNPLTRLLAHLFIGKGAPGEEVWRVDFDPYPMSISFVNTHLLANELTQEALTGALQAGRAYIAFDSLADSSGFTYVARDAGRMITMGEAMPWTPGTELAAASPLPCRFTVVKDGEAVHMAEGRELTWKPDGPGKYRIEVEVYSVDEWIPWVYTNPLQLTTAADSAA